MGHKFIAVCGFLTVSAGSMFADFSYHESSKITGGAAAAMMKVAGVFSKAAREPIESTVAIRGNKLAHRSAMHGSIIDLDSKTITQVDLQKKQYSVMTFDEMKQAMENMAKKMTKDNNADMKLSVSANPTGKTKQFGAYDAKEIQMKITMDMTDPKSKQSGAMVIYTNLWIADNVPGYSEVSEFYQKMAQELNWTPGGNMFMQQPEVAKGMAEAFKEVSKLKGTPVFQVMAMGPEGMAPPTADAPQTAAEQPQTKKPSAGSVLGGALGGRLGGFGRKKSEPAQEQPTASQQQQQQTGSLLEMQTEYSAFAATADPSLFEIPAGFKQVEPEMKKMK
jgi:hypothetical protein